MQITYLGHSCFEIQTNEHTIIIDPFLVASPNYDIKKVTDIFVTHGHGDHLGSAIEISQKTGAKITAIFELSNYCSKKGGLSNGIGLGSWINFSWGKIVAVPAFHSSSTPTGEYAGNPCGYIFEIEGKRIYHAGDTCLNSEIKFIGDFYKPDISMLPVGGIYTMDVEHALVASEWLNPSTIIPMHYNTFDAIKIDIQDFEEKIKQQGNRVLVMKKGEKIDF